jgi:hypothetical protein
VKFVERELTRLAGWSSRAGAPGARESRRQNRHHVRTDIGNHGSHLLFFNNVNDAFPALPSDTSSPQSRRRVSTSLGNLSYYAPQGLSSYNALTVSVEKRYSAGFTLLASYTWSRALGVDPASILGVNWFRSVVEHGLRPPKDGDLFGLHSLAESRLQPLSEAGNLVGDRTESRDTGDR